MVGEEEHPYYALRPEVSLLALEEEEERERAQYVSWAPYPSWERKRLRTLPTPSQYWKKKTEMEMVFSHRRRQMF